MLRTATIAVSVIALTLTLLPAQALALLLRHRARRWIPVYYHRIVCALIGVRVRVEGRRDASHHLLIAANHASWLDIPVITAIAPVAFVAKKEVASWPVFGWLAKLQRSIFVDRDRRHHTGAVTSTMADRLAAGDPVVLFAEGTSGDGRRILPFRSALIGAAGELLRTGRTTEVRIQPLSIAYVSQHGLPISLAQRDRVAWFGDAELLPHLFAVLSRGAIDVTMTWGEPVVFDAAADRKRVAAQLETSVRRMTVDALRGMAAAPQRGVDAGGQTGQ